MSTASGHSLPDFSSHQLAIEQWILAVSSHPCTLPNPMPTTWTYISSNEDDVLTTPTHGRTAPAIATTRPAKRSRADSSPLAGASLQVFQSHSRIIDALSERLRVVVSRSNTPFELPAPREPTPSASELGLSLGTSDAGSTTTAVIKRRDKTKLKRLNAQDPNTELHTYPHKTTCYHCFFVLMSALGACIERIKESKSSTYSLFEYPTIEEKSNGPPTHYIFQCKK